MINKIKSTKRTGSLTRIKLLLCLVLFYTFQNVFSKSINESDQKKNKTVVSLPKIIVLQTYKDWSSRLGTNQTTPQTTALVFEESKEVRTELKESTTFGTNQNTLITSTEKIIDDIKYSTTTIAPKIDNKTDINLVQSEKVNAHNIAAQVLSRILHITPLLALASNGVPHRRLNYTKVYVPDQINNVVKRVSTIDSLNEIDIDSDVRRFKPERMSASGISFPTTTPTTIDMNVPTFDTTPTSEYIDQPLHSDDEQEHPDGGEQEEEEPPSPEDQDDYEDDDEMESFRYPVRVNFQDNEEDNGLEREGPMPFVMPNIDLNPESLKQKGCRTVVKEVQAIPLIKGHQNLQNPNHLIKRTKRNTDNSRKYTSIVMTKECHFPGDEGASSQEIPQAVATAASTAVTNAQPAVTFQSPAPSYDDYDEDFDFRAKYPFPSKKGLVDRMESKSSNDRRSYADNPDFRRDNTEEDSPKDEFGFDDSNFYNFNSGHNKMNNKKLNKSPKPKKSRPQMSSSSSDAFGFDDEEFGPQPKKSRKISRGTRLKQAKGAPLYRNEREREGEEREGEGGAQVDGAGQRQKRGKKKPKKINRSFAFFRKREPKDKDPNESDYAVSYGRGNFQSFSDSYDSDRDGPRKKGKGMQRSTSAHDDDDDDD